MQILCHVAIIIIDIVLMQVEYITKITNLVYLWASILHTNLLVGD